MTYCGTCKHFNIERTQPEYRKIGLFRCDDAKDRALFVYYKAENECEKHEEVEDIAERREKIKTALKA